MDFLEIPKAGSLLLASGSFHLIFHL